MLNSPGFVTVETVMFFGLGFLLALLLMLAFMPAVHDRAVRLTRRKYSVATPSEQEMQLEKDRLRADFAMSTRKLENDIDKMQRKTAAHFSDVARKAETIAQLKETLDTRDTLIAELQDENSRLTAMTDANAGWDILKNENAVKTQALRAANDRIAVLMAEIGALTAALDRRIHIYDKQQQEITALSSQSDALRLQLQALENAEPAAPSPAFIPGVIYVGRRPEAEPAGDHDVIRRALESIEMGAQPVPHDWISPPSNGAVPFGH